MIQFLGGYWSNRLNLLHSLLYVISTVYYMMILWLPYFFISIGYKQGAYISIAYPLAYILSGIIFQPFQNMFGQYLGIFFLGILIIDNGASVWLTQLGDDPS